MHHSTLSITLAALVLSACTISGPYDAGQSSSASSAAASSVALSSASSQSSTGNPNITLSQPLPNATVTSPLTVSGEARGNWYFEASFPVKLLDGNGSQIAIAPAQAQSDWMTTNFVPYSVTLTFATPATSTGTLVLEKDNPSGLPENDASISIPVQF